MTTITQATVTAAYSWAMYYIRLRANKEVILVCPSCNYEVFAHDFEPAQGHPRTEAATIMAEHRYRHSQHFPTLAPEDNPEKEPAVAKIGQ